MATRTGNTKRCNAAGISSNPNSPLYRLARNAASSKFGRSFVLPLRLEERREEVIRVVGRLDRARAQEVLPRRSVTCAARPPGTRPPRRGRRTAAAPRAAGSRAAPVVPRRPPPGGNGRASGARRWARRRYRPPGGRRPGRAPCGETGPSEGEGQIICPSTTIDSPSTTVTSSTLCHVLTRAALSPTRNDRGSRTGRSPHRPARACAVAA
jgi:hypothetical protein